MSIERPLSREQKIRMYRDEVIKLMYPAKGKRLSLPQAVEKVLAGRGISAKVDLQYYMSEIGALIKKEADERRLAEKKALTKQEPVPEKSSKSYWQELEDKRLENLKAAAPLFAEQIEKDERRHFNP